MAYQALHYDTGKGATPALDAIVKTSRLRQNAQGFWQIHYSEPAEDGRWRSKTFSTRTQDFPAAQAALTDWLTQAQQQKVTALGPQKHTIGSLIDLYLEAVDPRRNKAATYTLRTVRQILGNLEPRELDQQVIRNYISVRVNQRDGGGVKDGTLRRELSAMLTAINHAIDQRIISSLDGPAKLKLPANSPPRLRYLSHDEEPKFWATAQAKGGQIALFVALGLDTAARRGAILGLTWDRVDLRTRLIDYRDPKIKASKKRRVVVPIGDRLMPVLEKTLEETGGHGPLFNSKLRAAYHNFTRQLEMEWVTPHVMRHTWASLAAIDGVPLYHIAKMLGDTIATVEKTYAHLAPDHLHDIVNRPRPTK